MNTIQPVLNDSLFEVAYSALTFPRDWDVDKKPMVQPGDKTPNNAHDEEVLSMILAIDTNEIAVATEAGNKNLSPRITQFAEMLQREHAINAVATMKLANDLAMRPLNTPRTTQLRAQGTEELNKLMALEGKEFGEAYIDAMISDHSEIIAMIDWEMLRNVKNESLIQHLTKTRDCLADYLNQAKEIQGLS